MPTFRKFTPEFIDQVRDANDVVEIIGQYTELKGNGHRLMGRCPFPDHSDKSPSFSVSGDQQFFYCFGCKKGGNVFHFLEYFNGLTFPEAVEFLARRASIALPEPDSTHRSSGIGHEQKDLLLKLNRVTGVFYHQSLKAQPADAIVKKYLVKRGLSDEIVEKFRLGYAREEWQGLAQHLKSRNAPLDQAEALGLIKPKRNSRPEDSHFDLFRDRLMFPIFSATGDVIGFGGRTLSADGIPKYLNSSDSPVFNKSRVLYGIHETGRYIRAQDAAIVVEGYMDAISLYAAGIKNVVAILGTAFTPEHAKILKRYTLNVTMLLDGDEAGLNGAERSLPILLEAGILAKGLVLPDKMDPDDFVRQMGADRLREDVERAPELFSLLLVRRWLVGYHGTPSDKVRVVELAGSVLERMESPQLRELYLLELSRELDVDLPWLRRALSGEAKPKPVVREAAKSPQGQPVEVPAEVFEVAKRLSIKSAPRDEAFLVSLILHRENLMRDLIEAGAEEITALLSHQDLQELLRRAVLQYKRQAGNFSSLVSSMVSQVDVPAVVLSAMDAVSEDSPEGLERRLLGDYLTAIRRRSLKTQAKTLASQLKGHASPRDLEEKLEQFMNLQRDRQGLNKGE